MSTIDLNADMGESFGPWKMGDDTSLLDIVTSANIACGFHAGDPDVMASTMRTALEKGVGIGAHPGFNDLQGFGRQRLSLPADKLRNMVQYQIGAAQAIARANGAQLRHVKLHGALGNMTSENAELARTCFRAALDVDPNLIMVVLAATAQEAAARELDCAMACEIFADRAYNDDCTLVDRREPDAVIHDADIAADRIVKMVKDGAIHAVSGRKVKTRIDTICLHGDTPGAVSIAEKVKRTLVDAGIKLKTF